MSKRRIRKKNQSEWVCCDQARINHEIIEAIASGPRKLASLIGLSYVKVFDSPYTAFKQ